MEDSPAFHAFCHALFSADGTVSVAPWAERIGCREPAMIDWCLGNGVPTEDDLVRIHFAVMGEPRLVPGALRDRWMEILELPVCQALRLPRLLSIEGGEPEPGDATATVGDVIEDALRKDTDFTLGVLPRKHRVDLLHRFCQHAETLSHYVKKG